MHGFLNISKPSGITSFDVIRRLKRCFPRGTRIGHLGTLDPMATGVLPIAIGQATRIIPYLERGDKEYIASMTLGAVSDTQDAWGNITDCQSAFVNREQVEAVLPLFKGIIWQEPPMYSAVHHDGIRLYELARQGQTVTRKKRPVEIKSLELLGFDNRDRYPVAELRIVCSRGTYIRTLCHDMGQKLGTGAFLSALTRTRSGEFTLAEATSLDEALDCWSNLLLPLDYPLQHWPAVILRTPEDVRGMENGQTIVAAMELSANLVRVYRPDKTLLAIAQVRRRDDKDYLKPERVFHIQ
ncbi:MAG TPA: tRNA pseudouridine(55) synthase TruB [Syntrophomonadaceae bacterium]|nr:tRNA pseudouridine(55) synthase TruB [Syntrophomonadaceae bacterium]HQA06907.1 tRNA pseudouridine(55) synthase TruB [Syntrophomonadaceae bacterium]HQE22709.1 tRNA pseudouridine(55) synthase TruB [Syntrophomonadaceae bacterium]